MKAGRAERLAAASVEQSMVNTQKIAEVHESVNGKMEKLLKILNAASKAEGVLEQKEKEER